MDSSIYFIAEYFKKKKKSSYILIKVKCTKKNTMECLSCLSFILETYQCLLTGDLAHAFHHRFTLIEEHVGLFHIYSRCPFLKSGCSKVNLQGVSTSLNTCLTFFRNHIFSVFTKRKLTHYILSYRMQEVMSHAFHP